MTENFSYFMKQLISHFYCNIYTVSQKKQAKLFLL